MTNVKNIPPLCGLVLAGGKSVRMKMDKSLLYYHGKSQVAYCFELLSKYCQEVYLSNREDQVSLEEHTKFPQIHDKFDRIGPLGGILTAMMHKPQSAWLVLACDLPFIDHLTIKNLLAWRGIEKHATAYTSAHHPGEPEPLCAIYEPKSMPRLQEYMRQGICCPKEILMKLDIAKLDHPRTNALDNVNSEEDFKKVVQLLTNSKHR